MPIFEYSCNSCHLRKFSALVGVSMHATPPVCPRCGSGDINKLVSRFSRVRSEDDAMDSLADMADTIDPDDPKAIRRLMKEMAGGMGDSEGGEDFEQMMEEAIEEEASGGGAGGAGGTDESALSGGAGEDF